jgi:hypothetical protein
MEQAMSVSTREAPLERPASLLAPFALMGAVGGWLAGYHFLKAWPIPAADATLLEGLALLVTAGAGAILGRTVSRVADRDHPADSMVALTIATLLLLGIGGALVGGLYAAFGGEMLVGEAPRGVPIVETGLFGLFHGLAYALMFLPAFMVVLVVALRVGRARAGSLVDAADRRAVWLATALVLSVTACTASCLAPAARLATHALALVCVGGVMAVFVFDVRALETIASEMTGGAPASAFASRDRPTLASRDALSTARRELVRALFVDGAALLACATVLLAVVRLGGRT